MHTRWSYSIPSVARLGGRRSGIVACCSHVPFVPPLIAKSNPKVRHLKLALQNGKKRKRNGDVFLEGHRLILDALLHGLAPQLVILSQRAIDAPLGKQLLAELSSYRSIVSRVDDSVIATMASTETTQGVCAIFTLPALPFPKVTSTVVLCDRIRDPGNLGSIIRSSYIFGADAVVVIEGCDAWSPKVIRSSMGYGMRFPVLETTWPDWIQFHKAQTSGRVTREHVFLAEAPQNTDTGRTYYSADLRVSPLVLVIGSESVGISDEARRWCPDALSLSIPMMGKNAESLNAAAACAVLLGEIQRQRLSLRAN